MGDGSFRGINRRDLLKSGDHRKAVELGFLDYSLMMALPLQKEGKSFLQFGLVGYGQWQTTDDSGPGTNPTLANNHYKVNAIGFALNVILPPKGVSIGVKYFNEYGAESTVEGDNIQISAAVTF